MIDLAFHADSEEEAKSAAFAWALGEPTIRSITVVSVERDGYRWLVRAEVDYREQDQEWISLWDGT